jgi:hypothetical protein
MDTAFSALDSLFNPFVLMVDGSSVLAAVQRSDRLNALARKVVRLLDEPDSESGEDEAHDLDRAHDRLSVVC